LNPPVPAAAPAAPLAPSDLEAVIGYRFANPLLLNEALTHPSVSYEAQAPHADNQRLEFLGDAVIQLILTRELFIGFPDLSEGVLTKLRSQLVSRTALQRCALRINLGAYLKMGKGEAASGGRDRPSTLADALEALIGAIYLDSDLPRATDFMLELCENELRQMDVDPDQLNPKGQLQELLQTSAALSPTYTIVSQEGPDHCKVFEAAVHWQGRLLGRGLGQSKKQAEAEAASDALHHPEVTALRDRSREARHRSPAHPETAPDSPVTSP
jgi:ribonuclease-3